MGKAKANQLTLGFLYAMYVYTGIQTELHGGEIVGFRKEKDAQSA